MNITDHQRLAKELLKLRKGIRASDIKTSRELTKLVNRVDKVRNMLDTHYHNQISEDQFRKYGHVYYVVKRPGMPKYEKGIENETSDR